MDLWLRPYFKILGSSNNHADCKFTIGDANGVMTYPCHKLIFGCASEVFERMLYGGYEESDSGEVVLKDVEPHIFEKFRDYLYGYELDKLKEYKVETLMKLAQFGYKYLVNSITEDCIKALTWRLHTMDISYLLKLYECAHNMNKEDFIEKISKVLKNQWKSSMCHPGIYEFSPDVFLHYFQMTNGYQPEPQRFIIIELYIKFHAIVEDKHILAEQFQIPEIEPSNKAEIQPIKVEADAVSQEPKDKKDIRLRREFIESLLSMIDFKKFKPKEFYDGPGKSNLLTIDQKYEIMYIVAKQRAIDVEVSKIIQQESRRIMCSYCRNIFHVNNSSSPDQLVNNP